MEKEVAKLKLLKFKKKMPDVKDNPVMASVFLRKGLIGLEVKDGVAFMNTYMAIQLILIILTAIQAKNTTTPTKRK